MGSPGRNCAHFIINYNWSFFNVNIFKYNK
jgi:hypothetical protein